MTATRLRSRRSATTAETADNHGSAASRGVHRSRRPYSPGARQTASARATRRSPEAQRSVSGDRSPPATTMSAQGLAFTAPFVVESNTQFRPGPPRTLASATYTQDFNAVKALGRRTGSTRTDSADAARAFLGGQRQRPLESGGQPDRARQPPVDVRQQPAPRSPEHRHGRHRVHDLEREATLRRRSGRGDLAAADGDHAGGDGRHRRHRSGSRLAPARHHACPPGVSGGPPGSERRCCDRPAASLCRRADLHADSVRPAGPDVREHLAGARRRQQRPGLGRDALPQHGRAQRRRRRSDRRLRRRELDAAARADRSRQVR